MKCLAYDWKLNLGSDSVVGMSPRPSRASGTADLYVAGAAGAARSKTIQAIFQWFVFGKPMPAPPPPLPPPPPALTCSPLDCCNFNPQSAAARPRTARRYISINTTIHSRRETSHRLAHNPHRDAASYLMYVSSQFDATLLNWLLKSSLVFHSERFPESPAFVQATTSDHYLRVLVFVTSV